MSRLVLLLTLLLQLTPQIHWNSEVRKTTEGNQIVLTGDLDEDKMTGTANSLTGDLDGDKVTGTADSTAGDAEAKAAAGASISAVAADHVTAAMAAAVILSESEKQ